MRVHVFKDNGGDIIIVAVGDDTDQIDTEGFSVKFVKSVK